MNVSTNWVLRPETGNSWKEAQNPQGLAGLCTTVRAVGGDWVTKVGQPSGLSLLLNTSSESCIHLLNFSILLHQMRADKGSINFF